MCPRSYQVSLPIPCLDLPCGSARYVLCTSPGHVSNELPYFTFLCVLSLNHGSSSSALGLCLTNVHLTKSLEGGIGMRRRKKTRKTSEVVLIAHWKALGIIRLPSQSWWGQTQLPAGRTSTSREENQLLPTAF